jgi:hypothetical protein
MGFAPATKKLLERVYQFVTPLLLGIGVYVVYKQGKQIEAILLAIIGCLAIFYYWIKFFRLPPSEANDVWPPFVSTCPDYLTLVSPFSTNANEAVCIDFVGVSLKPTIMKKSDPNKMPRAGDPEFEAHVFRLTGISDDPRTPDKTVAMCEQVKQRGLTWAHVCDDKSGSMK